MKKKADFDYEMLDAGIRDTVRWLHDCGFETCDSGDGRLEGVKANMEGALDLPHVVVVSPNPLLMTRLADAVMKFAKDDGLWTDGSYVEASYNPQDGVALVFVGNVVVRPGMVLRPRAGG